MQSFSLRHFSALDNLINALSISHRYELRYLRTLLSDRYPSPSRSSLTRNSANIYRCSGVHRSITHFVHSPFLKHSSGLTASRFSL